MTVFNQALTVTQTQTLTATRSTAHLRTLSVTETQTPSILRPTTRARTLSVTETQTPTETPLAGIHTVASGSESNPTYAVKVVGMTGGSAVTLANAEADSVTWTLNSPDEYELHFPKNAYSLSDLPIIGTAGTGAREVQIYRNGDLLTWGPAIAASAAGRDGAVQIKGAGVDWYLNRRFVDGPIPNLITNPDFESGATGWTANNVTFTQDTNNFVTGSHSAKLVATAAGGDTQIHQNGISVGPNAVGVLVTLSAWYFIDTFTAPCFSWLGLYMEGGPTGGNPTQNNWFPIDSATKRGDWQKTPGVTLWVPPGEVWNINVRLYSPQGTIHWDDVRLVAMDSVSTASLTGSTTKTVDIASIIRQLVAHEQSTAKGKSDLNIGVNAATTGVTMAKTYQFVDHVQFDQAMQEFLDRNDGVDYFIDYTPTTRTYRSLANKRGTDRHASVTLRYDVANPATSNCTDYRFQNDAGRCITRQTVLGEDNGPDREQGESSDASAIGGVILQDVKQSPQGTKASSLQPIADERLERYGNVPVTIDMDVIGSSGLIPTLKCGDLVTVSIADGFIAVSGTYRIMRLHLDVKTNILTVTVTVDSL